MIGLGTLNWKYCVELTGIGRGKGGGAQLGAHWRIKVRINVDQSHEGSGGVEEKQTSLRDLTERK